MKVLIVCALIGSAFAGLIVSPEGQSSQTREQDAAGNYKFAYNEDHSTGGTFRQESGNALGQVSGSYGLRDLDGRNRIVHYIADELGFRVSILTNEPGVEPKSPASATINAGAPIAAAEVPIALAPTPLAYATKF